MHFEWHIGIVVTIHLCSAPRTQIERFHWFRGLRNGGTCDMSYILKHISINTMS